MQVGCFSTVPAGGSGGGAGLLPDPTTVFLNAAPQPSCRRGTTGTPYPQHPGPATLLPGSAKIEQHPVDQDGTARGLPDLDRGRVDLEMELLPLKGGQALALGRSGFG